MPRPRRSNPPSSRSSEGFCPCSAAEATARFVSRVMTPTCPELSEGKAGVPGLAGPGRTDAFFAALDQLRTSLPYGQLGRAFVQLYERNAWASARRGKRPIPALGVMT